MRDRTAKGCREVEVEAEAEVDSSRGERAVRQHRHKNLREHRCSLCHDNIDFEHEVLDKLISLPTELSGVFLAMAGKKIALHKFHCRIVPLHHIQAVTILDSEEYEALRNYMKLVTLFLSERKLIPVFFELVQKVPQRIDSLAGKGNHTFVEVIPVPENNVERAEAAVKIYLESCGEQWSTHKKVIDDQGHRYAPRGLIPDKLPYCHVSFGMQRGIGHIIEPTTNADDLSRNVNVRDLRAAVGSAMGFNKIEVAFDSTESWTAARDQFKGLWKRWGRDPNALDL